jgi:hypothetical protein
MPALEDGGGPGRRGAATMNRALRNVVTVALALAVPAPAARSAEWHVTPQGRPDRPGTAEAPWDITSALGGRREIGPGDTIWIGPGTYHATPTVGGRGYEVRLVGREGHLVHVRAVRGTRATIDGGLNIIPPATYVEVRDLEITVSEPRPAAPLPPDPTYRNINRPWGGLNVNAGMGCKFINLVIHDNSQGVSWWSASRDSELYGCILYDNGWPGTDRGHGHAIYTQNADGTKTIADCILTGGHGYTLHAYGSSRADVDNYLVAGNIAYAANTFLIGGGKPSHNIRAYENILHGVVMQLGYSAPRNEDCEARDNIIVDADLRINRFERVNAERNLVLARGDARPKGVRAIVRPNKYDPHRAHLAVLNWEKRPEVEVDAGAFLQAGAAYRLLDPRDIFGTPVRSGTADGRPIRVPMAGEFAAFVLMKGGEEGRGR